MGRSRGWFRPIVAPTMALLAAGRSMMESSEGETKKKVARRGNSFCHVVRRKHIGQEIAAMTLGNQKWNGAAPAFRRRATVIGRIKWFDKLGRQVSNIKAPKSNRIEPVA